MTDRVSMNLSTDSWENEGGSFSSSANGEMRGVLDPAVAHTRPVDTSPRSYLFHALERVLNGDGLDSGDFEAAITEPENLTRHENDAWEQLHRWADEADVRARDKNYTDFHLDWLRDLHSKLAR